MITVAQSHSLCTNVLEENFETTKEDPKCKLCKEKDETVPYRCDGCSLLAQSLYKSRHECIYITFHWNLFSLKGPHLAAKWLNHRSHHIVESIDHTILRDFSIQADHEIQVERSEIASGRPHKSINEYMIIDVAVP